MENDEIIRELHSIERRGINSGWMDKQYMNALSKAVIAIEFMSFWETNDKINSIIKEKVDISRCGKEKPIVGKKKYYCCPRCKKEIQRQNYCDNCGQAIDWSE